MRAGQFSLATLFALVTAAGILSRIAPGITRDAVELCSRGDWHWVCLLFVASVALSTWLISLFK